MHFWLPNTITTSTQKPMTTVVDYLLTQTTAEQIFELLSQGVSQRQVAQKLGVGIATVTRGSRALQAGSYKIDTSK
jgi:Trp operon repressor